MPLSSKQGEEETFTVDIPAQSPGNKGVAGAGAMGVGTMGLGATYKITLVWSDPPGVQLQNDLDLIVVAADGSKRHGNMGLGAGFDRANNVEQVVWTNMPAGPAKVTIRAFHIANLPQPYARSFSRRNASRSRSARSARSRRSLGRSGGSVGFAGR